MDKIEIIADVVCRFYELDLDKFVRLKRINKTYQDGRAVFSFFAREYTNKYLSEIGDFIGGRKHCTIINQVNSVKDRLIIENRFREELKEIKIILDELI